MTSPHQISLPPKKLQPLKRRRRRTSSARAPTNKPSSPIAGSAAIAIVATPGPSQAAEPSTNGALAMLAGSGVAVGAIGVAVAACGATVGTGVNSGSAASAGASSCLTLYQT